MPFCKASGAANCALPAAHFHQRHCASHYPFLEALATKQAALSLVLAAAPLRQLQAFESRERHRIAEAGQGGAAHA